MMNVTTDDIQRDIMEWLRRVREGETLVVFQDDQPVAEFKPIVPPSAPKKRIAGLNAGEIWISDDFDALLP
jgi:antitoxin (DNA-binding transcriptional repressor) of toxin-antitoxin stability system